MLSYAAIDKIAMDIVQEVCSRVKSGDTIVLYDATAFGDLLAYRTYVQQAMLVQAAYSSFNLAQPTVVQPKIGPTAAVAEIVSIIMQFATATTSQSGSSITIPDAAIITKIAHDLLNDECPAPKKSDRKSVSVL